MCISRTRSTCSHGPRCARYIYIHLYTHIYMYIYTYIYIHTYMCISRTRSTCSHGAEMCEARGRPLTVPPAGPATAAVRDARRTAATRCNVIERPRRSSSLPGASHAPHAARLRRRVAPHAARHPSGIRFAASPPQGHDGAASNAPSRARRDARAVWDGGGAWLGVVCCRKRGLPTRRSRRL